MDVAVLLRSVTTRCCTIFKRSKTSRPLAPSLKSRIPPAKAAKAYDSRERALQYFDAPGSDLYCLTAMVSVLTIDPYQKTRDRSSLVHPGEMPLSVSQRGGK